MTPPDELLEEAEQKAKRYVERKKVSVKCRVSFFARCNILKNYVSLKYIRKRQYGV